MATIKKTVRKTVKKANIGCGPGDGCMSTAEGRTRREVRQERSMAGERLDQKLMRGLGLATREGQERRQADRWARKDERKDNREYRRDQRRSSGGYFGGGFGGGGFKKGGKLKKAQTGTKVKKAEMGTTTSQTTKKPGSTLSSQVGNTRFDMDSTGYSQGAKRFPLTITKSYPSGKEKVTNRATTREGIESMIKKTQGSNRLDVPYRRAGSIKKKNPYIKSQKTGGKTSKRK